MKMILMTRLRENENNELLVSNRILIKEENLLQVSEDSLQKKTFVTIRMPDESRITFIVKESITEIQNKLDKSIKQTSPVDVDYTQEKNSTFVVTSALYDSTFDIMHLGWKDPYSLVPEFTTNSINSLKTNIVARNINEKIIFD